MIKKDLYQPRTRSVAQYVRLHVVCHFKDKGSKVK